jgi:hypothetical protein
MAGLFSEDKKIRGVALGSGLSPATKGAGLLETILPSRPTAAAFSSDLVWCLYFYHVLPRSNQI